MSNFFFQISQVGIRARGGCIKARYELYIVSYILYTTKMPRYKKYPGLDCVYGTRRIRLILTGIKGVEMNRIIGIMQVYHISGLSRPNCFG